MNQRDIREQDYQQGLIGEHSIFQKLTLQGYSLEKSNRYDFYDFKLNSDYLVELKSRQDINKDTYDTTILPYSKIKEFKRVKKDYRDLILIFSFSDNDNYYVTYKQLCKAKPCIQIKPFNRYSGFKHKSKLHLFIPTHLLKPLEQLVLS